MGSLAKAVGDAGISYEILAGGTDLLDRLKERIHSPQKVINIKNIPELNGIRIDDRGLTIGATTPLAEIASHPRIAKDYPVLAQAALSVGTPQLRNMGTLGGNLCQRPRCWYFRGREFHCLKKGGDVCYAAEGLNKYHAILGGGPCFIVHPSDLAPALIALDATLTLRNSKTSRKVAIGDFYQLPEQNLQSETVLRREEIVAEVEIPAVKPAARSVYLKFRERQSMDFALSSVAAVMLVKNGRVSHIRIVLGGVAPVPWRARKAEEALLHKPLTEKAIAEAARLELSRAEPLSQNTFKIDLTETLIRRALSTIS